MSVARREFINPRVYNAYRTLCFREAHRSTFDSDSSLDFEVSHFVAIHDCS